MFIFLVRESSGSLEVRRGKTGGEYSSREKRFIARVRFRSKSGSGSGLFVSTLQD